MVYPIARVVEMCVINVSHYKVINKRVIYNWVRTRGATYLSESPDDLSQQCFRALSTKIRRVAGHLAMMSVMRVDEWENKMII